MLYIAENIRSLRKSMGFTQDEVAEMLFEHALVLSLFPDPEALKKLVAFCEQVLAGNPSEKVRHTIRAAICFIYLRLGETQKAQASAQNLPHVRESREIIMAQIQDGMTPQQIDTYLQLITIGE